MSNLNDMNDLYNAQDVILLFEITENCFQLMYDKCDFNPRKCNSASNLSGCIERDLSKVIIALPTSNELVEFFEKHSPENLVTSTLGCRLTPKLSCQTQIKWRLTAITKIIRKIMDIEFVIN